MMCAKQNGDSFPHSPNMTVSPSINKVLIVLYWTHLFKDNGFNVHETFVEG